MTRCLRLRANLSKRHTRTALNLPRRASFIRPLSSGLLSLAPEIPLSTCSATISSPRLSAIFLKSESCISQSWSNVLTLVAVCSNCDSGDTFAPATPSVLPTVTGDLTYQDDLVRKSTAGKAGYSGNPTTNNGGTCSNCHYGGSIPAVTLNGPTTVASGSTNTYTLQITGEQIPAGGLDVSVTGGTLAAPETGTKIEKGEVVQTTARLVDSTGAISWTFDWTAPIVQADTTLTMYGAGASVDLEGDKPFRFNGL